MKKLVLIVILAAGFQQLKAQQLLTPMPKLTLLSDSLVNPLKPKANDNPLAPFNKFTIPDLALSNLPAIANPEDMVVYSKMPIVKLPASNDHMPILNPVNNGMHYDLLVKKVLINPEPAVEKTAP